MDEILNYRNYEAIRMAGWDRLDRLEPRCTYCGGYECEREHDEGEDE